MKPGNAIEVNNITKNFKVYLDKGRTLKEMALFSNRRKYEIREVLKGISFEVKKGEAIGLIGHNGCGKSTTLKLLTKIMYPDSGSIEMKGRVSSLIELGAGFHPDMSGRQNIYTNASIFGLTRKEIEARLEDIIVFSELEEFIDNPVRTYSSGMYMRLAFSVAINVDADILLIDEILAVGDANFQAKCFNKLREIKGNGVTIVIVSHSLGQIEQICDRSIWIEAGKIYSDGSPRDVHPAYMDFMSKRRQGEEKKLEKEIATKDREEQKRREVLASDTMELEGVAPRHEDKKELGNLNVRIVQAALFDEKGNVASVFNIGNKIILRVVYERKDDELKECEFGFNIFRNDGTDCYGSNTVIDKVNNLKLKKKGEVSVLLNSVLLLQGKYKMDIAFHDVFGTTYHHIFDAVTFEMMNHHDEVGICRIEHQWLFDGKKPERR